MTSIVFVTGEWKLSSAMPIIINNQLEIALKFLLFIWVAREEAAAKI